VESPDELAQALGRHLAEDAATYIFGNGSSSGGEGGDCAGNFSNGDHDKENNASAGAVPSVDKDFVPTLKAAQDRNKKRGHMATFYVVCTNPPQLKLLEKLVGSIPCRLFVMQGVDFFHKSQGTYEGMGIDRLSTLSGAASQHGLPALVIDGGSALTYTALNADGVIVGGGISPGIEMKLKALEQFTGALPLLDIKKETAKLLEKKRPSSIFGKNTNDAIICSVLNEISCHLRGVISVWKKECPCAASKKRARDDNSLPPSQPKTNDEQIVHICGGSGHTIEQLLSMDYGRLIKGPASFDKEDSPIRNKHINGLIHFGITSVVCLHSGRPYEGACIATNVDKYGNSSKKKKPSDNDEDFDYYIGVEVAKDFNEPDADGDFTYRGHVVKYEMYQSGRLFRVVYTDGDEEDVGEDQLKEMISHHQMIGAKRVDPVKQPHHFIGSRVAKTFFDNMVFYGTITSYDNGFWNIEYDDGDMEDFDETDLNTAIELYDGKKSNDPETMFERLPSWTS